MYTCEICSKSFNHNGNMIRHVKEVHYGKKRYEESIYKNFETSQFNEKNSLNINSLKINSWMNLKTINLEKDILCKAYLI